MMLQTTTAKFLLNFKEFERLAQREPVEITRHGRREFVLMSADRYDWLFAASKRSARTADAPTIIVGAVRRSKMNPRHTKRDALME
jgi:prevent-host-death family protein